MAIELPTPLIVGTVSNRCLDDILRDREPEYEHLFHQGQEFLAHYYLAPFQRPAVWSEEQSQRLVESVFLGIAIGSFVVSAEGNVDKSTGKFDHTADWIIDGQQRLRALTRYIKDDLEIFVGTPSQHRWSDLDRRQQRQFLNTSVGFIRLEKASEDSLRELYDRLNFGGTAHTEDQRAKSV